MSRKYRDYIGYNNDIKKGVNRITYEEKYASKNGLLKELKELRSYNSDYILQEIAKYGHLECLMYYFKYAYTNKSKANALFNVVLNGHIKCIKYIVNDYEYNDLYAIINRTLKKIFKYKHILHSEHIVICSKKEISLKEFKKWENKSKNNKIHWETECELRCIQYRIDKIKLLLIRLPEDIVNVIMNYIYDLDLKDLKNIF